MYSNIKFTFSYEELQRKKGLLNEIKEVTGDPNIGNDMEVDDILEFRYGVSIDVPSNSFLDTMKTVRSWDPDKFDKLAPSMLRKELIKMRKAAAATEAFLKTLEGE